MNGQFSDYNDYLHGCEEVLMPVHDWSKLAPAFFHDFHLEWISAIKHTLNNGVLPEDYYAMAEQWTPTRE